MVLDLTHPELPDCTTCSQWMHDDHWRVQHRNGKPIPRRPGTPTPCWKCPKVSPTAGKSLSAKNRHAYLFYLQIKATGQCPADPIVLRNCSLIRLIEDRVQRSQQDLTPVLLALAGPGRSARP